MIDKSPSYGFHCYQQTELMRGISKMKFELYSKDNAPVESKPLLEDSLKVFGFVPNLHGVMAEVPGMLSTYKDLHNAFQATSFDAEELTVVWQTINVEHECHYCVPAHTGIAHMMKVDSAVIDALVNKTELPTKKLQTLHETTLALVRNRGHLSESELAAFIEVGYENRNLLEIVLGLTQKVMSNYVNHLAETPVDEPFQQFVK
jgi:alkylhydroperoxidase family enzyme